MKFSHINAQLAGMWDKIVTSFVHAQVQSNLLVKRKGSYELKSGMKFACKHVAILSHLADHRLEGGIYLHT